MSTEKYIDIINQIEAVRAKNNKNWMDLLKLAFKHSPKEASEIFMEIFKEDKEVNRLAKKLIDESS
mgnify:CR=1 FL=1